MSDPSSNGGGRTLDRRGLLRTACGVGVGVLAGCSRQRSQGSTPTGRGTGSPTADATTPAGRGDAAARGPLAVVVDGTALDLTRDRFRGDEGDDSRGISVSESGDHWLVTGEERLPLAEGLDRLPTFGYDRDGWRTVTVDGSAYDERTDGTEVGFSVDDGVVDPEAHELTDGDAIRVEVTTGGARVRETAGSVNASGPIDLVIDGEPFDLTQDRFQAEHAADAALAFHLHAGDGQWYMEADRPVTVGEGLDLLPHVSYDRAEGYHTLAIDEDVFDERVAGTELLCLVDDALVDPTAWELADGEELMVVVGTGD